VQAGRAMAAGAVARPDPRSFAAAVLDVARGPAGPLRRAARRRAEHYSRARTARDLMRIHRMS
jgi:hypothetical protein